MPKKPNAPEGVTARDLAHRLGVSRDTIFTWTGRGLLPPVALHGAATRYGASHQLRAKVIAKLRAAGVPYDDIATALAVPDAELAAHHFPVAAPAPSPPPPVVVPSSDPLPATSDVPHWQRVELLPGLELHVVSSASAFVRRIADEVIDRYRAAAP